jgi:hypothetical protein
MSVDSPSDVDAQVRYLQQMVSSIEAINARIARLAMALGVTLANEHEVAEVMSRPVALLQERRDTPERRAGPRSGSGPERRVAHLREELRGLLVLRYSVEKHCVEDAGVTVTQQIMAEAEAHLLRRGFKPGADGIDLDHLFNQP